MHANQTTANLGKWRWGCAQQSIATGRAMLGCNSPSAGVKEGHSTMPPQGEDLPCTRCMCTDMWQLQSRPVHAER